MKEEKRNLLIIIIVFVVLNINFHGSAFSSQTQNNSLQWFPSLAADNNTVYIAWADERNGNYTRIMNNLPHKTGDIYLSKGSFQNGWVFDKNIRINEIKGTTGHGSPSIAVDNNNLYVVWEDDRFGFEELYFSTAEKNNIKFKKDLPVVVDTGSQVLPSIAILNGTVYVTMMNKKNWDIDFTKGNYDIYFSHGIKENRIWRFSQNVRVNDDPTNASQYTPSLAFENGSVYIAWYDDRNKDFDIFYSTGRLENNNWKFDKNIRINDDTGNTDQMHPSIAVRNGEIFAVWEDEREGASNIYFSKSISRNVKVNDDLTESFTKPNLVLLGLVFGSVIFSMVVVTFLRGKMRNEKRR